MSYRSGLISLKGYFAEKSVIVSMGLSGVWVDAGSMHIAEIRILGSSAGCNAHGLFLPLWSLLFLCYDKNVGRL